MRRRRAVLLKTTLALWASGSQPSAASCLPGNDSSTPLRRCALTPTGVPDLWNLTGRESGNRKGEVVAEVHRWELHPRREGPLRNEIREPFAVVMIGSTVDRKGFLVGLVDTDGETGSRSFVLVFEIQREDHAIELAEAFVAVHQAHLTDELLWRRERSPHRSQATYEPN